MDLDLGIISEAEKRSKKKLLLDYLYANLKNHNFWAYRYFFCELLSLANVIGESIYFFFQSPDHLLSYRISILISITLPYNSVPESWEKTNDLGFTFFYFYHFLLIFA